MDNLELAKCIVDAQIKKLPGLYAMRTLAEYLYDLDDGEIEDFLKGKSAEMFAAPCAEAEKFWNFWGRVDLTPYKEEPEYYGENLIASVHFGNRKDRRINWMLGAKNVPDSVEFRYQHRYPYTNWMNWVKYYSDDYVPHKTPNYGGAYSNTEV